MQNGFLHAPQDIIALYSDELFHRLLKFFGPSSQNVNYEVVLFYLICTVRTASQILLLLLLLLLLLSLLLLLERRYSH